jgi:uncharacterized delta-60 repeat protein
MPGTWGWVYRLTQSANRQLFWPLNSCGRTNQSYLSIFIGMIESLTVEFASAIESAQKEKVNHKILNTQKKMSLWLSALIIASSLFLIPSASAAVGDLDTSFDTDGKVTTTIGPLTTVTSSTAIQSDGKIVVAGYSQNDAGAFDFVVVRYNADGSPDTSFNGDGIVTTDIGGPIEEGRSIVIQSDGKIVVAGSSVIGGTFDFAVARYNADGSPDTSFNGDGIVTTGIGGSDLFAASIAIQSDGKFVVAGYSQIGDTFDFVVVRYNADGSPDTSFNGDGIVTTNIGGQLDFANTAAIQSDGKIVVAGYSVIGGTFDFVVVRYNADGSPDTSFNGDGIVTTDIGDSSDIAN